MAVYCVGPKPHVVQPTYERSGHFLAPSMVRPWRTPYFGLVTCTSTRYAGILCEKELIRYLLTIILMSNRLIKVSKLKFMEYITPI